MRLFSKSKQYVESLKDAITVNNNVDKKKLEELHKAHQRLSMKRTNMSVLRVIFFIGLYAVIATSITTVLQEYIAFLSEFMQFLTIIFGIIGTTVCFVMIAILTVIINNYDNDIDVIQAHIIAIYSKYDIAENPKLTQLIKKIG